jgi:hypothetical protein
MPVDALVKRILLSVLLGMVLGVITTEVAYRIFKRENRAPARIELIIPAGTAERVAAGQAPPSIPANMNFVVGDTLVVVNQDKVDHQLGPLWVPPGASASMNLSSESNYMLECSFQPGKYFGIQTYEPVTWSTRLAGILITGLPLSALFAVYGILITPDKKKKEVTA